MLSDVRRAFMAHVATLFERHLGRDFEVADFSQHYADSYVQARESGRLVPTDRRATSSPAPGTIRNELQARAVMCSWAMSFPSPRRPLIPFNPTHKVKAPEVKNPARPLATEARYRALLSVASKADAKGRLETLLVRAGETPDAE